MTEASRSPSEAELVALRRQVVELEEELAAWRAAERSAARAEAAADELDRVMRALRRAAPGRRISPFMARFVLLLLSRPGHLFPQAAILAAVARRDLDDIASDKLPPVAACRVRAALRAMGFPDAIETEWGRGYRLRSSVADALRAALGIAP